MREKGIDPSKGLGDDLFLFVSTLTPIVNVDLLVVSEKGVLLSWRDEEISGNGWYIPGGCVRYKETFDERIHATALKELGCDVTYKEEPLKIAEIIHKDKGKESIQSARGHFISFLFQCQVKDINSLNNCDGKKMIDHLGWFRSIPDDFLHVQDVYIDTLQEVLEHI